MVWFQPQDNPGLRDRLDPGFWDPRYEQLFADCACEVRPLGDFIVHLTYGPIVTAREPPLDPRGVTLLHQGQIAPAGVDPTEARRIVPHCDWDLPRCRVRRGDVLFPRSGEGSLLKHRAALFSDDYPAVVGSFVDLIRVADVQPVYVLLFLKSKYGRLQIQRLCNGVGTPNVSFAEIRELQMPLLPPDSRRRLVADYQPVHRAHEQAVSRKAALLAEGLPANEARRHPEVRRLFARSAEALDVLVSGMEAAVRGEDQTE